MVQQTQNQNQGYGKPNKKQNDPWMAEARKGDFVDSICDWVVNAHSPKGLAVLGIIVAVGSQVVNLGFWISTFSGVAGLDLLMSLLNQQFELLGALLWALLVSCGSSFFQGYPIVSNNSKEGIYNEMLSGLFKPQTHHLPRRGIDPVRAEDYDGASRKFRGTMKKCYMVATFGEVVAGIIFSAGIFGSGLAAIGGILMFIFSIAGTQVGLLMMTHARNVMLTPAARDARRKLESKAKHDVFSSLK